MFVELITIAAVVGLTYLFFRAFGPRGEHLFLNRQEKLEWDTGLAGNLGTWVTITNISGTITSFATVLFLMGSVKFFGPFALSTGLTIFIGAFITNRFTRRLVLQDEIATRFEQSDQTAGVIAFLLWNTSPDGQALSRLAKRISLAAIASIVWLEFLIFSEFTSASLQITSLWGRTLVIFLTSLVVIFFVLRYGIRGFTFADFLHAPLIALATLILFLAVLVANWGPDAPWTSPSTFFAPQLPVISGIVFAAHVTVLNCLQVLCTEPHWLRVWLFKDRETTQQVPAMAATGTLWVIMLLLGFAAAALSGKIGDGAILSLVSSLGQEWLVFVSVFWVAVTAALFSTADTQAYCLLLVSRFDPESGKLDNIQTSNFHPTLLAFLAAFASMILYALVKVLDLPPEKIIFVIIPSVVTLAPPLVARAFGRVPTRGLLWASLIGYVAVAAIGFLRPDDKFDWTLSAVFVPLVVTLLGVPRCKKVVK